MLSFIYTEKIVVEVICFSLWTQFFLICLDLLCFQEFIPVQDLEESLIVIESCFSSCFVQDYTIVQCICRPKVMHSD